MTFRFGADGRLLEAWAIRYNDARGRNELWVNRKDADREFAGIRVPAAGEARWRYDSGRLRTSDGGSPTSSKVGRRATDRRSQGDLHYIRLRRGGCWP